MIRWSPSHGLEPLPHVTGVHADCSSTTTFDSPVPIQKNLTQAKLLNSSVSSQWFQDPPGG